MNATDSAPLMPASRLPVPSDAFGPRPLARFTNIRFHRQPPPRALVQRRYYKPVNEEYSHLVGYIVAGHLVYRVNAQGDQEHAREMSPLDVEQFCRLGHLREVEDLARP